MEHTLENAIKELFDLMRNDYKRSFGDGSKIEAKMFQEFSDSLKYTVGNSYIKLIAKTGVRGFIVIKKDDKKFPFGTLLKAATAKAPARNFSRGNVFELEESKNNIRWTGIA